MRAGWFGYEQLFFRFYMKFNREHAPIHHYGSGLIGFQPPTPWAQGGAGERPKGDARWTTQVEPGDFTSWNFYSYWHEMGGSPPRGQTWGNNFESGVPPRTVAKERWICLEVMVKLNDIGDSNGEQAYWLDGKLSRNQDGKITSYLGKGFPLVGTWIYDKFQPYTTGPGIAWDYQQGKGVPIEGGKPFPGFVWRSTPRAQHQRHLALPLHVATRAGHEPGLVGPLGGRQEVHRPPDADEPVRTTMTASELIEDSSMHRPFLCVVRVAALSFCLHLAADPTPERYAPSGPQPGGGRGRAGRGAQSAAGERVAAARTGAGG